MTRAPQNLLAVRRLLLDHLDTDPDNSRDQDLEPAEVGIVGDPAHRGGYHCGSDRVVIRDYSVVESVRDSSGLTLDASALDVGWFTVSVGGRAHDLRSFSTWFAGQCAAGSSDSRDIREIIYSPDGRVVRRWDRLGRRTTGDNSHLWHTHFSFFRDSTKANRDQTPLFRRYLTTIGLIATPPEESTMEQTDQLVYKTDVTTRTVGQVLADLANLRNWLISPVGTPGLVSPPLEQSPLTLILAMARSYPALVNQVTALADGDFSDEQAIVAGVLAGLTPEQIAQAIPPTIAQQVTDELARRLAA
ncbi:hypothetical protein KBX06_09890 [Micromonospora sp. C31]|uniref:hypothetical protein n=1 Tax=Micromonospora sp. C31 TaxID=2824876 RepID=UPI001B36D611|nr:hypothetical protein [Micromonospora sp. C31]MBQ1073474.1 hypothetical protein [Micromonospora sp. C31]